MVWYDEFYSTVRIPDVMKALDRLNGSGTINQIEKELTRMYRLPRGMLKNKELIKEPLETLMEREFVALRGSTYHMIKRFRYK